MDIKAIQQDARKNGFRKRPAWPMIILRSPKSWTGPKVLDGKPVEGTFRSHQVPMGDVRTRPDELHMLEQWMHSYRPEELFDKNGKFLDEYGGAGSGGHDAHGG